MKKDAVLILITNELGMGMHADTEAGRKFTDLQGWINQYIAKLADEVIFMVSGIPLRVKGTPGVDPYARAMVARTGVPLAQLTDRLVHSQEVAFPV